MYLLTVIRFDISFPVLVTRSIRKAVKAIQDPTIKIDGLPLSNQHECKIFEMNPERAEPAKIVFSRFKVSHELRSETDCGWHWHEQWHDERLKKMCETVRFVKPKQPQKKAKFRAAR